MSRGGEMIGINWGSSNFRAWRIAPDGLVTDHVQMPCGVAGLDREGMRSCIDELLARWGAGADCWASGMIGSNIGWLDAGYCDAPSCTADLAAAAVPTRIGELPLRIVPGLACTGPHGGPDVMRGEEVELFGYLSSAIVPEGEHFVLLPGTHSKWVACRGREILGFFTSMGGEIFDRLTAQGLLASVTEGAGEVGEVFAAACDRGRTSGLGLGSLLFEVRARAVRAGLGKADAASHVRGLVIGSEIGDAMRHYPMLDRVPVTLIGNASLCRLFYSALAGLGIDARIVASEECCIAGYRALASATGAPAWDAA